MVVFAEHRQRQRLHDACFPSGHVRLPLFPFRERKRGRRKTPPPVPSSVWGRGQSKKMDRAAKYLTTHSGHHRVVHGTATGAEAHHADAALVGELHAGERGVKPGGTRNYKNAGGENAMWARTVGNNRDGRTDAGKNLLPPTLGAGPRKAAYRPGSSAGVAADVRGSADFARGDVPGLVCWPDSVDWPANDASGAPLADSPRCSSDTAAAMA